MAELLVPPLCTTPLLGWLPLAGYVAGAEAGYAWGAACGAAASLAALGDRADAGAQPDQQAVHDAVSPPFKHAAQAVVASVMAEHTAAQQAGDGSSSSGYAAGSSGEQGPAAAPALLLSYADLQRRQQMVVSQLQQQGLALDLARPGAGGGKPT